MTVKTSGLALAALLSLTFAAPVEAAKAVKAAKGGEYTLDPEKGDVRASLTALATAIGATIVGDSPKLAQPAPAAVMTGTPDKLIKRLLKDQSYVVKTDGKGKITQVVIMSGQRGKDPLPASKPPAATTAANTGTNPVTATMLANAHLAQAPTYGGQPQFAAKSSQPEPIPPQQPAQPQQQAVAAGSSAPAQPVNITPEMQAQIAAATQQARGQLDTLVQQLKAACPAGQKC